MQEGEAPCSNADVKGQEQAESAVVARSGRDIRQQVPTPVWLLTESTPPRCWTAVDRDFSNQTIGFLVEREKARAISRQARTERDDLALFGLFLFETQLLGDVLNHDEQADVVVTKEAVMEGTKAMGQELASRLAGRKPWAAMGFECRGRTVPFLGVDGTLAEHHMLHGLIGRDVPWIGMMAWGEVASLGTEPAFHNYTYPVALLVPRS
jgi:hypothetical protein